MSDENRVTETEKAKRSMGWRCYGEWYVPASEMERMESERDALIRDCQDLTRLLAKERGIKQ